VRTALDLLLPIRCLGCDATGEAWCDACDAELEPFEVPAPDGVERCVAVAAYASSAGDALPRV
jgi:hypothetical protein